MAKHKEPKPLTLRERLAEIRRQQRGPSKPDDDEGQKAFPLLWEYLTTHYKDGEKDLDMPRLSVQMGDGEFLVSLGDAALAMGLSATSQTLQGAFQALETALAGGEAAWSSWRGRRPQLKLGKDDERNGA